MPNMTPVLILSENPIKKSTTLVQPTIQKSHTTATASTKRTTTGSFSTYEVQTTIQMTPTTAVTTTKRATTISFSTSEAPMKIFSEKPVMINQQLTN